MAFLETVPAGVLAGVMAASWVALVSAEVGRFDAWVCVCFGVLGGLGWGYWSRPKGCARRGRAVPHVLALLIAMGSLLATVPPGEMILGGWDPGVYVHTAAAVSAHRSLLIPANDIAEFDEEERDIVSRDLYGIHEPFLGMRLLPNGKLSPQFLHLFPCLLAVFYSFWGAWGALMVNPLLNVGCILAMYVLVTRLFDWRWGLGAALLFALNPAQLWQAKFSTAEMLSQLLLLSGAAVLIGMGESKKNARKCLFSGACFGMALLTRYDAVMFLVPLCLLLLWHVAGGRMNRGVYIVVGIICICGLHVWLHMRFLAPHYHPLPSLVVPALVGGGMVGMALVAVSFVSSFRDRLMAAVQRWKIEYVTVLAFAGFVVFAWYVRPRLTINGRVFWTISYWLRVFGEESWLAVLGSENAWNMVRLQSVFGGAGLLLGCVGICVMLVGVKGLMARAWLVSSVCVMVIFVSNVFHDHFMMWVTRRFVPVVVPLLTVGIVAAIRWGVARLGDGPAVMRKAGAIGCMAVMVICFWPASHAMASMRNWPGLIGWYEGVNAALPAGSTVFCDQPGFAAPLRFLYGHESYEVSSSEAGLSESVGELIEDVTGRRPNVFFLSMKENPEVGGVFVVTHSQHHLESSILSHSSVEIPLMTKGRGGHFVLYKLTKGAGVR